MISFTTIVLVFTALTIYYRYFFGYWKKRNVPTLPPNIVFGNITAALTGKSAFFDLLHEAYVTCKTNSYRYIGFFFFAKPILVATDMELIKNIMVRDFVHFHDREFYLDEKLDPLSPHLVSLKGKEWDEMRRLLSPAFTPSRLKLMSESLSVVSNQLVKILDSVATTTKTVSGKSICSQYIVDAIGSCIFGIECNTLQGKNGDFQTFSKKVLGGSLFQSFKLFMCLLNTQVLYFLRIPYNSPDVQKFFLNLTKTTVEYREKHNIKRKDMMQSLIQVRNNNNIEETADDIEIKLDNKSTKILTIEQIAAEALIFFGAAYETTSSITLFCMYQMLCNPSIKEKARKATEKVLKRHNGQINFDSVSEMDYLEMCIYETVRWYPPASIIARVCTKDYQIPDSSVIIEKGTNVFIPAYEVMQDPEYYPEPQKFIPERFLPENVSERPQFSFLGFGEGPHVCIGQRFSLIMAKTFLSIMLTNYDFSISPKTKLPLKLNRQNVLLSFESELYLNIEKLQKA